MGSEEVLFAKYTDTDLQWVKQAGGVGYDVLGDITIDLYENLYLTGSYENDMYFDGNILTLETNPLNSIRENSFIAKYDKLGNFTWADKITTKAPGTSVEANGIKTDLNGNLFVTGSYEKQAEFGNYTTPIIFGYGMFISKYANSKFEAKHNVYQPECGANGAVVDLAIAGGRAPYTFNWSTGATTEDITNVSEGNYTVTVSDAHNCTTADTAVVEPYTPLSISVAVTNVSVVGASDGAINLTVTGGSAPYNFVWSNGSSSEDLINIPAGDYTVTVTDFAGSCVKTTSASVTATDTPIQLSFAPSFNCTSGKGCIDLTVTGGTAPYSFLWSSGQTIEDICNLNPGWYSVLVSDAEFTSRDSVYLQAATVINTDITGTNTCVGTNTGSAVLEITGGTSPFNILWSNSQSTATINNLAAGKYHVTVHDAGNCSQTDSIEIFEDTPPVILQAPTGLSNLCREQLYQNTYSTPEIGADSYIWSFMPVEAGTINGNNVIAYVDWVSDFLGSVQVKVKATNHCGTGNFSPILNVAVGHKADIPGKPSGTTALFCVNDNTVYSTTATAGADSYEWKLLPSQAGVISGNQNTTTVDWAQTFSGIAHIFVRTVNGCGVSDWSDTLDVEIHSLPTSDISGNSTICQGSSTPLSIAFTGTAPWNLTYTNGTIPTDIVTSVNPYTFNVSDAGTYQVTSVSDAYCTGTSMTGQAIVAVNELPTSDISGSSTICQGTTTPLSIAFTGITPWNLTYTDGTTPTDIITSANPYTFNVSDAGTYQVTSVSDANCTGTSMTGQAIVAVDELSVSNFTYTVNLLQVTFTNNSQNATSYLWDFGDGQTSTEINPVHTYAVKGSYDVTLTAISTNCGNDVHSETIVLNTDDISNPDLSQAIKIYPNPAGETVTFEISNITKEPIAVEMFDINGKKILSRSYNSGSTKETLNTGNIAKGIYTIKIKSGNNIDFRKLVLTGKSDK